jgi:regulator of RNase E activity RraA
MQQQPGFIIKKSFSRPPARLIAKFSEFSTDNLSDVMGKSNTLDYRIKPIHPGGRILGPCVTVRTRPGDNLLPMKAIELAKRGDVIVIAGGFDTNYSVWGGIMSLLAAQRGIAGVVTDGLVRDAAQIKEAGLVVFAAGLTPVGPSKDGKGQINQPIVCGGVMIRPGDILYGDADGVVVIPQLEAQEILVHARERVKLEAGWMERINQGELILVDSDEQLIDKGCLILK